MLTHSATLYAAAVLIWGSTWFAIRFQLGVAAPEVSVAYRFALVAALLLAPGAWTLSQAVQARPGRVSALRGT